MNKTYEVAIERAKAIAEGIEKNASELKEKGYDTAFGAKLSEMSARLTAEAEKYDQLYDACSAQRKVCHEILDTLKDTMNDAKSGIKSRYLQPEWLRFGMIDKK